MSLLARRLTASTAEVPALRAAAGMQAPWDDFWYGPAGGNTVAGIAVSETLAENCLSLMACVRLMQGVMGSLPFGLYEKDGRGRKPATGHAVHRIIHNEFNENLAADEGRAIFEHHADLRGNAFALKDMSGRGELLGLIPLHPDRMMVTQDRVTGVVRYSYRKADGTPQPIPRQEIVHYRGHGSDGIVGISQVNAHRESIGLTQAAEMYGAAHFGNGAEASVVIKFPQGVSFADQAAADRYLKTWNEKHQGPYRARKAAILENGGALDKLSVNPDESQFLETRVFQLAEMARIIGFIPLHLVNSTEKETTWGTGMETQNTAFVQFGLLWRFVRWEGVVRQQLLAPDERDRYYAKFSPEGLLRGDTAARGAFYQVMRRLGAYTADDILELEDRNPRRDGGDTYWEPLDVRVIDGDGNVVYEPAPKASATPTPPSSPAASAFRPLLEATLERVYRVAIREWNEKAARSGDVRRWEAEHMAFMDSQLAPVLAAITAARVPLRGTGAARFRPDMMGDGIDPATYARDEARLLLGD